MAFLGKMGTIVEASNASLGVGSQVWVSTDGRRRVPELCALYKDQMAQLLILHLVLSFRQINTSPCTLLMAANEGGA